MPQTKPPGPWSKPGSPGFGVARPPATATPQIENDQVRVMRWDFPPGAETGWHRHGFEYVVVPVTRCVMRVELPDGEVLEVTNEPGAAYTRLAGAEHNVINAGTEPMAFVEIELLTRAG